MSVVVSVREQVSKGVKHGKVVSLVEAQGAKMGSQQMPVKIAHTDIVVIAMEKAENM